MIAHKLIDIMRDLTRTGYIKAFDSANITSKITNAVKFEFSVDVETTDGRQWVAFENDTFQSVVDYQMPFPLCLFEVPKLGVIITQQPTPQSEIKAILFPNYRQGWGLFPPKYELVLDLQNNTLVSKSYDDRTRFEFRAMSDKFAIFNLFLFKGLHALNCTNVRYVDIEPPKQLNKKRARNGKVPMFTYKTLVIDNTTTKEIKPHQGGTHASPRLHLRRGHIRRYATHSVWIEDMIVGKAELGTVEKDYLVVNE